MAKTKNYLSLACMRLKKMRSTPCDLLTIPRLYSSCFKTTLLSDKVLSLRLKESKNAVRITLMFVHSGVSTYLVYSNKNPKFDFQITATTNKELLTKLIQKYEFFN